MAATSTLNNLEKLTEDNFDSWKLQMKSVLIYNELWGYVSGTKIRREPADLEWSAKDEKALALIVLSVTKSQLSNIKKARTAKEAWDQLSKIYESRGPVRRATLYKQLYRMKKEPGVAMSKYVNDFTSKAEQLEEAGIIIPPNLLSIMLLGSLPTEYESFCIAMESRDEIPSIDALKSKLIEEEARQSDKATHEDANNSALVTKDKANRSAEPSKKGKPNEHKPHESVQGNVYTAGEQSVKSLGIGEIRMEVKLNNRATNRIRLENTIYVPSLRNNLVSVSSMTEKGSKEFSSFLQQEGITRQLSVEYTPQQNGVAERANHTLVEMSRCLLLQANLPKSLWAEMVNAAAFIRNRCPSRNLHEQTPFELWNGKKPFVGFMKVIGCKALEKGKRHGKFEPKDIGEPSTNSSEETLIPLDFDPDENNNAKIKEATENEEHSDESLDEQASDDEEMRCGQKLQNDMMATPQRGPGRPSYVRTGTPGRPKKVYKTKQANPSSTDPLNLKETLSRSDKEL
ncbi:uncharacterized protein [Temnothorax longispinosus]|uniref:uncharacterized protein n=1 Tax=Temnothorax longispinosus TaxID=300112 RepID=UPI003A9A05B1